MGNFNMFDNTMGAVKYTMRKTHGTLAATLESSI